MWVRINVKRTVTDHDKFRKPIGKHKCKFGQVIIDNSHTKAQLGLYDFKYSILLGRWRQMQLEMVGRCRD